jgi:hypothetical protein
MTTQLQTLTDAELAELLKKAAEATPGPWFDNAVDEHDRACAVWNTKDEVGSSRNNKQIAMRDPTPREIDEIDANMKFIAAANPATVSALVSDYMRLRGIVAKLPVTKDGFSVVPGEDEVWLVNQSGKAISRAIETSMPECCEWPCVLISEVGKCYSTEAAALASQQEGAAK